MPSIDTLNFGLRNNDFYYDMGYDLIARNGETTTNGNSYFKEESRVENYDYEYNENETEVSDIFTDIEGRNFREIKELKSKKVKFSSGTSDINYFINIKTKVTTFEFSIPKYLYGHNLSHFPIDQKHTYQKLKKFILTFFLRELGIEIRWEDIKINRLDLCWNYTFKTLENKRLYKVNLPLIMKQKFNDMKMGKWGENDTVMYHTKNWSIKVYDKGLEFKKNDYEKLIKKKILTRKEVDSLLLKSKYIMRTEMTIRSAKMTYDFFYNLDLMRQVKPTFRRRFRVIKKSYLDSQSVIDKVCRILNRYMINKDNYVICKEKLEVFSQTDKFKDHVNKNVFFKLESAKRTKVSINQILIEPEYYKSKDMTDLLCLNSKRSRSNYIKYTQHKTFYFQLSKFERATCKSTYPQIIQFEENLMNYEIDLFKQLYKDINQFTLSKATPNQVFDYTKEMLEKEGIRPNKLKSYFGHKATLSDKEIVEKGYMTMRTIQNYKVLIDKINILITEYYPNSGYSLTNFDIPEKMKILDFNHWLDSNTKYIEKGLYSYDGGEFTRRELERHFLKIA